MQLLENPHCYIQVEFLSDISSVFSNFLQLFQREGPLVHVLLSALSNLVCKLMLRFLTTTAVGEKDGCSLCCNSSSRIITLAILRRYGNWGSNKEKFATKTQEGTAQGIADGHAQLSHDH